jgi:hypothetical protein
MRIPLPDELDVLRDVSARFDRAAIPFMLTGSLAMNYYAVPRRSHRLRGLKADDLGIDQLAARGHGRGEGEDRREGDRHRAEHESGRLHASKVSARRMTDQAENSSMSPSDPAHRSTAVVPHRKNGGKR